jgi:hypothetical protein
VNEIRGPEGSANYQCSAPPKYDRISITVGTGVDDAQSGSSVVATLSPLSSPVPPICLKASDDGNMTGGCINGQPYDQAHFPCRSSGVDGFDNWLSGKECVATQALPSLSAFDAATTFGTITISLLQKDPGCGVFCDNWDLQKLTVILSDSHGMLPARTLLDRSHPFVWGLHNCIARLQAGAQGSVTFSLGGGSSPGTYPDGSPANAICP